MMITIKQILLDTKETNNIRSPTSAAKRKVDTTREEEYEEYDNEVNQNTIDSNLVNTRLRRKLSMSEMEIIALEQKIMEQYRALLAKSNRDKKRATKKTIKMNRPQQKQKNKSSSNPKRDPETDGSSNSNLWRYK